MLKALLPVLTAGTFALLPMYPSKVAPAHPAHAAAHRQPTIGKLPAGTRSTPTTANVMRRSAPYGPSLVPSNTECSWIVLGNDSPVDWYRNGSYVGTSTIYYGNTGSDHTTFTIAWAWENDPPPTSSLTVYVEPLGMGDPGAPPCPDLGA